MASPSAPPRAFTFAEDPCRTYDELELNAFLSRRFFGMADTETIELCAVPPSQKLTPQVAYATNAANCIRLMREAESLPNSTGCYVVPNEIKSGVAARYHLNRWHRADSGRTADHEIERVRVIYIDCDAERVKGVSSTDEEKRAAYDLSLRVEKFIVSRLGDDHALARGDSGNGYAIFVAVEPFEPTKETTERVARFLKALAARFTVPGAKIDPTVFNPARLVPAFGTRKTKGADTPARPHRSTHFICRPTIKRVRLEVFA
jgi:hypothetical protein